MDSGCQQKGKIYEKFLNFNRGVLKIAMRFVRFEYMVGYIFRYVKVRANTFELFFPRLRVMILSERKFIKQEKAIITRSFKISKEIHYRTIRDHQESHNGLTT